MMLKICGGCWVRGRLALSISMLVIVLGSCTADKKPSKVEATLANMAKDVVIPIEAENMKNPLPTSEAGVDEGKEMYLQSCAICHGTDGHGHTEIGRGMYPPAMDLTSPHVQHWTDAELFWIIQNGVRLTGMPSWKSSISEPDTWKLVNFIHSLPGADMQAALSGTSPGPGPEESRENMIEYGQTLYRQEGCFMCHRLNGEGGKVGPDLTIEETRGRTTQWLIGHFKDPPAYTPGSIMPAFKNLTDEQLKALTTFLLSKKEKK
ncbi:MAG: c-type cytochrome [Acidobacteria bacterium]|nr:MAG: c-type cytochrome [Acidobacteriota bacterium]